MFTDAEKGRLLHFLTMGLVCVLVAIGLLMVTSASLGLSEKKFDESFYFFIRHLIYLVLGFVAAFAIYRVPLSFWEETRLAWFFLGLILLILVLLPGIGKTVNGSTRWIALGPITIQVSELTKIFAIVFLSGYLVQHQREVRSSWRGFLKPMFLLVFMLALIMKQPDFGTSVVLTAAMLGMMFLGGVPLSQFFTALGLVAFAGVTLILIEPYRLKRILAFQNPWADPFSSGYQLTQSLIAIGRGQWTGVGLGNSIQKMFYLPEAHTDFVFAILAEETGFLGVSCVTFILGLLIACLFYMGLRARDKGFLFGSYLTFGVALLLCIQSFINMGVNIGLLPTKGLTLPLISYGGSSLMVNLMMLALVFRVNFEVNEHPFKLPKTSRTPTNQVMPSGPRVFSHGYRRSNRFLK
jgi:cell division protein FtsW